MTQDPQSVASPTELEELLEVADLDVRLRRLDHQLSHLPEQAQLDEIEQQDRALREAEGLAAVELSHAEAAQRKLEGEVELLRQRREAEQTRMYGGGIVNPRELQSLRAELESTGRRLTAHEDQLLAAMESVETAEEAVAAVRDRRAVLAEELAARTAARDEAAQGLLAERAELQAARDRHREHVSADLLARYDAAAQRFSGVAIGRLEAGSCTACRIELPMVEVSALLEGPLLATCPMCQRLLVTV